MEGRKLAFPASHLAESTEEAGIFTSHLKELLAALSPETIGPAFVSAMEQGDAAAALGACAAYFRRKKEPACSSLRARGPYDRETADRAARGQVRVVNIDWAFDGGRIDFLFDPTKGTAAVNHEWLWQLNRHSFWADMARAYADTGDETYARAFTRQLRDWVARTSCPAADWNAPGSAWRTIECGLRLLGSWQVAFQAFRHSPSVPDEALLLMLASMLRQAGHLIAHPHTGNWLMMECNGVITFASLFPEFRAAQALRKEAMARFLREMEAQLLPDGMHNELSPDYQSVVFSCAANVLELARGEGFGDELPPRFTALMERTVHAALLLSTPRFTQPRTNDTYTIPTALFADRAAQLLPDCPAYAFVRSGRREGCPPEGETASAFLPYAGFCVMRSDWQADAAYLLFDVGPLGAGHMHQDKLNINLYKGSRELIYDDGGGQYEVSAARAYGLSGYDHNTVLVDGLAQNRTEPLQAAKPIDAGWRSGTEFDYARGSYEDGFGPDRVCLARHVREVRFQKPDFYCVRDTLTSRDGRPHTYELLFHLDTLRVTWPETLPGAILSDFGGEYEVLIVPAEPGSAEMEITSGRTEPTLRGWYVGRNDETLHPAATVSRKSAPCLEHTFLTLLFPVKQGEPLPDIRWEGERLAVTRGGKRVALDPGHLWE